MSGSVYQVRGAASDADLRGILELQGANLPSAVSEEERRAEGFVTLRHDLALLREMNQPWPHVIATSAGSGEVVGYALVMQQRFRERLPALESMFRRLEALGWRGRPVGAWRWYVMGQVCVAKAHRGRGLVERMYAEHRERMAPHFDVMITVIDRANTRSVRAHEKAGFTAMEEYEEEGGPEWVIVAMDLRAGG